MNFTRPTQTPQQEMVQVDRNETTSPFWRTASASSQRDKPRQGSASTIESQRKVIGASYSHADNLNLNSLNLSESRPRTPPLGSRNKSTPPPSRAPNGSTPPTRRTYTSFLSSTNDSWTAGSTTRLSGDGDEDDVLAYDEDEDEFGLPSIASMRRKGKRKPSGKAIDASTFGFGGNSFGARSDSLGNGHNTGSAASWATDNGEIADSRAVPSYPTTKSSQGKILRPQYKEILRDPANSLHLITHSAAPANANPKDLEAHSSRISRINKFKKILQASSISLPELREAAWSGLPGEVRAMSWQLLLGYLPTSSERRVATLERKRKEYLEGVRQAFERAGTSLQSGNTSPASFGAKSRGLDEAIWHQISIDVPRTNPHLELYGYEATQRSLERILYVWAIRHPASGYVQGINDLVTPFWQVFLGQYMTDADVESGMDPGQLPKPVLDAVEADSFWCLTKLLDGIQDNYIHAQPGIQRQVAALRDLTSRIDGTLAKHMEQQGVEFIQFSFRWMNCLLMREISVKNTVRMWDTYLAEDQGFSHFHLYVCAAFLVKWSDKLLHMDFQEIMMFLQSLPTKSWTEKDIELLLSEAFIWQSLFQGSKGHVVKTKGGESGVLNL